MNISARMLLIANGSVPRSPPAMDHLMPTISMPAAPSISASYRMMPSVRLPRLPPARLTVMPRVVLPAVLSLISATSGLMPRRGMPGSTAEGQIVEDPQFRVALGGTFMSRRQ
jgi:hypothetical protein